MVGAEGFDPPTTWLKARCSTKLSYTPLIMVDEAGFEPAKAEPRDLQSLVVDRLNYSSKIGANNRD